MKPVMCQKCNKMVNAEIVGGDVIYPLVPKLSKKKFYRCPLCGNYKEIFPEEETGMFVVLPSEEVRTLRLLVHDTIDPLWKSGKISRKEIYRRLSSELGGDYHNGNSVDPEKLQKAYLVAQKIEEELNEKHKE